MIKYRKSYCDYCVL